MSVEEMLDADIYDTLERLTLPVAQISAQLNAVTVTCHKVLSVRYVHFNANFMLTQNKCCPFRTCYKQHGHNIVFYTENIYILF